MQSIEYRKLLLATILLADVGFGTTMTLLGAALGTVAEELSTSESTLAWTITAPFLAMAVGAPVLGKTGDVIGLRRVFRFGITIFAAATLASALAPNVWWLIGLRALAGIGASASIPTGMALLMREYGAQERGRVLGWFHMVATGGPAVGLVTGGFIIDWLGWEAVFWIYGGLATVGALLAWTVVRPAPAQDDVNVDVVGGLLLGAAALALLIGLSAIERVGIVDWQPITFVVVAAALLVGFLRVEAQVAHPLLPLHFLRVPNFVRPLIGSFMLNSAYLGSLVLTPLLLQDHFGLSVGVSSALLLLRPGSFSLMSIVGGRLIDRRGPRIATLIGSSTMVLGMSLFVLGSWLESLAVVLVALVCTGTSFGLYAPAATTTVANTMDENDYGVASGMLSTSGTLGATVGLQLMVLALGEAEVHPAADFIGGFAPGIAFGICAVIASIGILASTTDEPAADQRAESSA